MNVRPSTTHFRTTFLTLGVAIALYGNTAFGASATTSGANVFATVAHATALRHGDALLGALPMAQPIHIEVALKMRDRDGLDAFIQNNAKNQAHGVAAQLMTPAQFLANHAPTQAQAQSVANYLIRNGYTHVVIAPNRLLVSADGTARTARDAFMTTFAQIRTHDGRIAFANTDEVRIPAALSGKVLAVVGLQNVHLPHSDAQLIHADAAQPQLVMTHLPTEFSAIYGGGGSTLASAANTTIGIVSSSSVGINGSINQVVSDLNTFTAYNSLPLVAISIVNTNGISGTPFVDTVSDVASQNIVGMAGGRVGSLVFYNIPVVTDANLTADFNKIVSSNSAKIIDVPFGICETDALNDGSAAADDAIFALAAAHGQTFSVEAGNGGGADQCGDHGNTPSWPAASQYVIAVNGTQLDASGSTWSSESVWAGTGGSPSTFEPMPNWQAAFGVPGTTRSVADVAFDADPKSGSKVIVNNVLTSIGGTDVSSALFAGLWARVLQVRGTTYGFAAPVIYALPAADFHDITVGTNSGGKPGVGFPAAPGYDFPSGRGSMILSNVMADSVGLGNKPPVASFTFSLHYPEVYFRDTSTDDGTIASHLWDFGDGTSSNGRGPHHTYAVDGGYTVSEKVTDNDGAVANVAHNVYVSPPQLLKNPGFETGSFAPWVVINNCNLDGNPADAHTGHFAAANGTFGCQIFQRVAIPATVTSATLSLYLWVRNSSDSATGSMTLEVTDDTTAGHVLATLATFSNLDGATGCNGTCPPNYARHTYDMTPFKGQTVRVRFIHSYSNNGTLFFVDDVTLPYQ